MWKWTLRPGSVRTQKTVHGRVRAHRPHHRHPTVAAGDNGIGKATPGVGHDTTSPTQWLHTTVVDAVAIIGNSSGRRPSATGNKFRTRRKSHSDAMDVSSAYVRMAPAGLSHAHGIWPRRTVTFHSACPPPVTCRRCTVHMYSARRLQWQCGYDDVATRL